MVAKISIECLNLFRSLLEILTINGRWPLFNDGGGGGGYYSTATTQDCS